MKFILFRPTFVTVGMMFQLVVLCAFLSSVSAAPQFGRPMFHVLDEAESGNVEHHASPSTTSTVESALSSVLVVSAAPTPTVTNDPVNHDVASTASPSSIPPPVQNQSSGASHQLGGVHTALVLSAAASAVYFVL
ncbi:hypothetical protein JVU11DRAFT_10112 [Chiua virens]|nr:hypothetical protein JVU11DRAFT_11532 [Chiua virens]KAG9309738.1 hypothetical protein JVU11DRAFT_10112 [Chiua virens]